MVQGARLAGASVHYCEVCYLAYMQNELAGRCEQWCRTHPSCSLEIGRHAVGSIAESGEAGK